MSSIAVLTYTSVMRDARVRRVCQSLIDADHKVSLISPDVTATLAVEMPGLAAHRAIPSFMKTRKDVVVATGLMAPSSLLPVLAEPLHKLHPTVRAARSALAALKPDIIHANDWMTLPAALGEKARSGARVVYDSHEMATDEHGGNRKWKLLVQPHVERIERAMISRADHVMTVGNGLAGALHRLYPMLLSRPSVVRNMPRRQPGSFIPVGENRVLTYVGLVRPERHVDVMIRSLAHLDGRYRLHVMGFGDAAYLEGLEQLAHSCGVSDRVFWKSPVSPDQVSEIASAADIGLFLTGQITSQQSLAFPNKLFEYIAAGLMVVSSDTPEIAALLNETGCGRTVSGLSVEALAGALGTLTDDQINAAKRSAVQASEVLNWQSEEPILLRIYDSLAG